MSITVRSVESSTAGEYYLTAQPSVGRSVAEQAQEVFADIRRALSNAGAGLFQERIFSTAEAMPDVLATRQDTLGPLADGVAPTCLTVPEGAVGPFIGVQLHAVRSPNPIRPLFVDGEACGRIIEAKDCKWVYLAHRQGLAGDAPDVQARGALEQAAAGLAAGGATFKDVVRTWWFMSRILDWYPAFNLARNRFFEEQGLTAGTVARSLPASTGIGITPYRSTACALDVLAVVDGGRSFRPFLAGGNQGSAYSYGSAFSRAAVARMPASQALFISGTAAIDHRGKSEYCGDISAQIKATIQNVRALFDVPFDADRDIVQSLVYNKNAEVERTFLAGWNNLVWPNLSMIADVCRPELLVEIEALAVRPL